jgi:UDP-N-acetylglucosamine 2-epimerase (non-hydrolysing)
MTGVRSTSAKVAVIIGTRPEAIKLAPVVAALRADGRFTVEVCLTAQHREMLDPFVEAFRLEPTHDLNLMRPRQTLAEFTAHALTAVDAYLAASRPDLTLVQGDTATVLAAALAAFYQRIPLGHVEAGLRTGNLQAPWPEEANRVLTTRLARLHFAPTEGSRRNLLADGVPDEHILVTGNTVVDALLHAVGVIENERPLLPDDLEAVVSGRYAARPMVLITGHRREHFGTGLEQICHAVADLAARHPDVHFVYPVHLNPRVREAVHGILDPLRAGNLTLTEPVSYLPFVTLLRRATLVLTDSGGVQEEAPTLGKPVLVMRDASDRPESLEAGTARLVGADRAAIVRGVSALLDDRHEYERMARAGNPYGDGHAAARIVRRCAEFLGVG